MVILTAIVALAVLVGANALYVAAEFAAVSVSRPRLRALAEDGHAGARALLPILDHPEQLDRYIAGCQVGITFSSLLLGAFGEAEFAPVVARMFGALGDWQWATAHAVASATMLIVLTVVQLLLGELVPKAIALQYPDRTALLTAPPTRWSLRVFAPLVWVFNGSGVALLRLLGVRHIGHRHIHSAGEIDLLLADAPEGGDLDVENRRRLRRVLQLSSRRARDLMVPRESIAAIDVDTALDAAVQLASEGPYTRFPAYRGDLDRAVGMIHTKDMVKAQIGGGGIALADMLRPIATVRLEATADEVLVALRERRTSQALVVDSESHVIGLVTLGDVLGDVFGAMVDEFKTDRGARRARRPRR